MTYNPFKVKSFSEMKTSDERNKNFKTHFIQKNVVLHKAISYLKLKYGCAICGYKRCERSLDFHHINPKEKRFNISNPPKHLAHWKVVEKEIQKCVLLCSNCHRELHSHLIEIPKGEIYVYK